MNSRTLAVLAACLFASSAAYAGPNEDLVSGLGNCAAISDGTARLACFDRLAAQAKTTEAAPVAAAPAAPAPVAQAPAPPAQIAAQAAPAKDRDESWFGIGNWFGGTSPAQQTTPQQFGSEAIAPPPPSPGTTAEPEPLDHITAGVADVAFNPFGRFTVFLDNGQIWQQIRGDTDKAHFAKNKKQQVTISRGLIGSYNLVIGDQEHLFKVKRIK